MKRFFLGIALLCSLCVNAQTITTQSSCDSNGDGTVDVQDVTNTANKVIQKTAEEQNVVTAEQLNALLNEVNTKLTDIQNRLTYLEKSGAYTYPFENGHEYVDLGLSVKWATCNVGAENPEDNGLYFAWGETTGHTATDDHSFDWANYKWCEGSMTTLTKYCTNSKYGTVDNKTALEVADDAATVNWGGSWRMPTISELEELRTNCTWTWTTQNGINGYKVTGTNGNSIFLPAAGCRLDSDFEDAGSYADYWSSLVVSGDSYDAYSMNFDSTFVGEVGDESYPRYSGFSVRPVCK